MECILEERYIQSTKYPHVDFLRLSKTTTPVYAKFVKGAINWRMISRVSEEAKKVVESGRAGLFSWVHPHFPRYRFRGQFLKLFIIDGETEFIIEQVTKNGLDFQEFLKGGYFLLLVRKRNVVLFNFFCRYFFDAGYDYFLDNDWNMATRRASRKEDRKVALSAFVLENFFVSAPHVAKDWFHFFILCYYYGIGFEDNKHSYRVGDILMQYYEQYKNKSSGLLLLGLLLFSKDSFDFRPRCEHPLQWRDLIQKSALLFRDRILSDPECMNGYFLDYDNIMKKISAHLREMR
ncbi:MAG: hypothetical protein N3A54_01565, partial [Patescibacteria group bacterium]|nr:hypothetical protein [Patescibacteria group bacterium]